MHPLRPVDALPLDGFMTHGLMSIKNFKLRHGMILLRGSANSKRNVKYKKRMRPRCFTVLLFDRFDFFRRGFTALWFVLIFDVLAAIVEPIISDRWRLWPSFFGLILYITSPAEGERPGLFCLVGRPVGSFGQAPLLSLGGWRPHFQWQISELSRVARQPNDVKPHILLETRSGRLGRSLLL